MLNSIKNKNQYPYMMPAAPYQPLGKYLDLAKLNTALAERERIYRSIPPHCSFCQTAQKVQYCTDCYMSGYCSVVCQDRDWKAHKIDCKMVVLNSWGLLQVYSDAQAGIPQAQVVLGIVFLYGLSNTLNSETLLQMLKKLMEQEVDQTLTPYAFLTTGCILSILGRSAEAEHFLRYAAENALVEGSFRLCAILKEKYEESKDREILFDLIQIYLLRYKNVDAASQHHDTVSQEDELNSLLQIVIDTLTPDLQGTIQRQRADLIERTIEALKKPKRMLITKKFQNEKLIIKPDPELAHYFLKNAVSQKHPLAQELLQQLPRSQLSEKL